MKKQTSETTAEEEDDEDEVEICVATRQQRSQLHPALAREICSELLHSTNTHVQNAQNQDWNKPFQIVCEST